MNSLTSIMKIVMVFFLLLCASTVNAVCNGYSLAIGNRQDWAGRGSWTVYRNDCSVVTSWVGNNPCTDSGIFSCSPAPIHFNQFRDAAGTMHYCVPEPAREACGNALGPDILSVCCY
ncbi:hypothetical protein BT63DRAFT_416102 [Microthyrium microscopicum]|uniref:Uncharacterized protein n=1 Tax=Microthyrium microscopicum TaxID=703497 RepID=A0A6A6U409_9PEZI|nr:hypothetical protein BT63DRAFT_416102 [Microthyrium microscopicum]